MRILVGWDDSSEADLLKTFLRVDNHEVEVSTDPDTILMAVEMARFTMMEAARRKGE